MRTTVDFDEDTTAAIEHLRRSEGIGVSEAANRLIRKGLLPSGERAEFRQTTRLLGVKIDVSNIAEAIDALEGSEAR